MVLPRRRGEEGEEREGRRNSLALHLGQASSSVGVGGSHLRLQGSALEMCAQEATGQPGFAKQHPYLSRKRAYSQLYPSSQSQVTGNWGLSCHLVSPAHSSITGKSYHRRLSSCDVPGSLHVSSLLLTQSAGWLQPASSGHQRNPSL